MSWWAGRRSANNLGLWGPLNIKAVVWHRWNCDVNTMKRYELWWHFASSRNPDWVEMSRFINLFTELQLESRCLFDLASGMSLELPSKLSHYSAPGKLLLKLELSEKTSSRQDNAEKWGWQMKGNLFRRWWIAESERKSIIHLDCFHLACVFTNTSLSASALSSFVTSHSARLDILKQQQSDMAMWSSIKISHRFICVRRDQTQVGIWSHGLLDYWLRSHHHAGRCCSLAVSIHLDRRATGRNGTKWQIILAELRETGTETR